MTSQINVDTIVDKAGTGGTNIRMSIGASAETEGGSTTTNVVAGLAKNLLYYDMNGNTIKDSLNTSTVTDINSGRIGVNLATAYTSLNNYQAVGFGNAYNGDSWGGSNSTACKVNWAVTNTTTLYDFTSHAGSYVDGTYNYSVSHGDLA